MCDKVYIPSIDKELDTVQDFKDFFRIDPMGYIEEGYVELTPNACLCQLDLDRFFLERPEYNMTREDETWGNYHIELPKEKA